MRTKVSSGSSASVCRAVTRSRCSEGQTRWVITERVAKKYFGNIDLSARLLLYDKKMRLEVTGIATDPPSNTEIDFDFVASLAGAETMPLFAGLLDPARVDGGNFQTWWRLKDASAAPQVTRTMNRLAFMPDYAKEKSTFELVPLTKGHLFGRRPGLAATWTSSPSSPAGVIAGADQLYEPGHGPECVRAKEVGRPQGHGRSRARIAGQFYIESAMLATLSFGLRAYPVPPIPACIPEFIAIEDR